MVTTRSMSRTAASGPRRPATMCEMVRDLGETVTWSNWTIKTSALCLFMKDYVKQYYEKHPPRPTRGTLPYEVDSAGQFKWLGMSAGEQAPWIQMAKEAPALRHFMTHYVDQYYEKHPPRPALKIPHEVASAGELEWRNMSATEKAPWIKMAKKMKVLRL